MKLIKEGIAKTIPTHLVAGHKAQGWREILPVEQEAAQETETGQEAEQEQETAQETETEQEAEQEKPKRGRGKKEA